MAVDLALVAQIGLQHGQAAGHTRRGVAEFVNARSGQPEGALRLADLPVDGIDVSGEVVRLEGQRDYEVAQYFGHGASPLIEGMV